MAETKSKPLINICMGVFNRPRLTHQALLSLSKNTRNTFTLTIVDDGSHVETRQIMREVLDGSQIPFVILHVEPGCGVVGRVKNLAVQFTTMHFGRGEYLYISDNDAYFTEDWDVLLVGAYKKVKQYGYRLIGPYRHPYHQSVKSNTFLIELSEVTVCQTDAVMGLGWLMTWRTWEKFGPLDAHALGTNQSEDWKFCNDLVKSSYRVGSIEPNVVHNCGLTDSYGKPCVGHEQIQRVEGVLQE